MFVTIITPFHEHRFDCDSARTVTHVPEPPQTEYMYVEIYKGNNLMSTHQVDKLPGYAVYFMNNSGQTVDSFVWRDTSKENNKNE